MHVQKPRCQQEREIKDAVDPSPAEHTRNACPKKKNHPYQWNMKEKMRNRQATQPVHVAGLLSLSVPPFVLRSNVCTEFKIPLHLAHVRTGLQRDFCFEIIARRSLLSEEGGRKSQLLGPTAPNIQLLSSQANNKYGEASEKSKRKRMIGRAPRNPHK